MSPFDLAIGVFIAIVAIAVLASQVSASREMGEIETEETLGTRGVFDVAIAFDGRRRWVEVVVNEDERAIHAYLTPSEARLLAEWLRTASAPGRTLADARRRRERAQA